MDFNTWTSNLHKLIIDGHSLFQQSNGTWNVQDRKLAFEIFGQNIFDTHLEILKGAVIEVLRECNPKFELNAEDRFAAALYGKTPKYSVELRRGLAETLVLLSKFDEKLSNCSPHKAKDCVRIIVHQVLSDVDWRLLASLNDLLPILAESDPQEYLSCLNKIVTAKKQVFTDLFSQESSGITGSSTISGILWSLECLAWDKQYLQQAILLLGELAAIDPGGSWSNRPEKSITSILLPWFPQTTANSEVRLVTLRSLKSDFPDIAWKVMISLLPSHHQVSSGTYKPKWNDKIPSSWEPKVLHKDYYEEVSSISNMIIELTEENIERTCEISNHLDGLPEEQFLKLMKSIQAISKSSYSEDRLKVLWKSIKDVSIRHKKYAQTDWAFSADKIALIDQTLAHIEPSSLFAKHEELFSNRDFDLVDFSLGWEESQSRLQELRTNAITSIMNQYGELDILKFAEVVENPYNLGYTCGLLEKFDSSTLIPSCLTLQNVAISRFCDGYVSGKLTAKGWDWLFSVDRTTWSIEQVLAILVRLPFVKRTAETASVWLVEDVSEFWKIVQPNPYQYDSALTEIINNLVEFKRYSESINCLFVAQKKGEAIDVETILKALLGLVDANIENGRVDFYQISEIIRAIQSDMRFTNEQVCSIEWAYLPVLGRHDRAEPKFLNTKIANEPEFFHQVITSVYRSDKQSGNSSLESEKNGEESKLTENFWRLLNEWNHVPGLDESGKLEVSRLKEWIKKVESLARESGHLEIAMQKIGETLFYAPPADDGYWIIDEIAEILNSRGSEYDQLRTGYSLEVYNSRGAQIVDPEAKPEFELSRKWSERSNEMLDKGYSRFAATLSLISDSYQRDAERILSGSHF